MSSKLINQVIYELHRNRCFSIIRLNSTKAIGYIADNKMTRNTNFCKQKIWSDTSWLQTVIMMAHRTLYRLPRGRSIIKHRFVAKLTKTQEYIKKNFRDLTSKKCLTWDHPCSWKHFIWISCSLINITTFFKVQAKTKGDSHALGSSKLVVCNRQDVYSLTPVTKKVAYIAQIGVLPNFKFCPKLSDQNQNVLAFVIPKLGSRPILNPNTYVSITRSLRKTYI